MINNPLNKRFVFSLVILFLIVFNAVAQSNRLNYYYKKTCFYYSEQNYDSLFSYLNKAKSLSEKEGDKVYQGINNFFFGEYFYFTNDYQKALDSYHEALTFLENTDSIRFYTESLNGIGAIYLVQGKNADCKKILQKALEIAKANHLKRQYSLILENLGVLHINIQDYNTARNYLSKASEVYKQFNDTSDLARISNSKAIIDSRQGNFDSALFNYNYSLELHKKLNDGASMASTYNNIAYVYQQKGDLKKALTYFELSLNELKKFNYKRGIAISMSNLGEVYFLTGQSNKSLEIAEELQLFETISLNSRYLSQIYAQLGNYKKAYEYSVQHKRFSDSLINAENIKNIAEIQADFDNVQKEREIEKLKLTTTAEREKNRRTFSIFIFVIIIIFSLLLVLTWFYRLKINNNKQLQNEIKERVKVENALKKLAAQLEKKVMDRTFQLQKAKEKAEISEKLKTSFLTNMSHEIRTPMNGIIGFIELLTISEINETQQQRYLKLIKQNSQVLLNLIEDIIDVSSIESGEIEICYQEVDFINILEELHKVYNHINSDNAKIKFKLHIDNTVKSYRLKSDSARLQQVISILLNNAFKFTDQGFIKLGCTIVEKKLRFYVKDSGIGIANENQSMIFSRFRQVEESNIRNYGGTGIGLYIAKNIVERLNGSIGVNSILNHGSEFYFDLPISSWDVNKQIRPINLMILENDEVHFELIKKALNDILCNINRHKIDKHLEKHLSKCKCDAIIIHIDDPKLITKDFLTISKTLKQPIFLVSSYKTLKTHYTQLSEVSKSIFAKPINRKAFQSSIETVIV